MSEMFINCLHSSFSVYVYRGEQTNNVNGKNLFYKELDSKVGISQAKIPLEKIIYVECMNGEKSSLMKAFHR